MTTRNSLPKTPNDLKVAIGAHNVLRNDGIIQEVERVYVHPRFRNAREDIAILRLASGIPDNVVAHSVCLPSSDVQVNSGSACYMTGWGNYQELDDVSPVLREARVQVQTDEDCDYTLPASFNTNNMVCTAAYTSARCDDDLGGPLVCSSRGRFFVYGITSWGSVLCAGLRVFTRTTSYLPWIEDIIQAN